VATRAERKKAEETPPKVAKLDHYEAVPSTYEGDPHPPANYDDLAGRSRAAQALRVLARKHGVRVSRIQEKCEWDPKRRAYFMHYWVDVLGRAKSEAA
jgi:hypothetical protein